MCDFVTMATIASAAVGGFGALQQGMAASANAKFQSKVAAANKDLAEFSARDAIIRGREEEKKQRRRTAEVLARQTVRQAASGIDTTFGSALDSAVDTAMLGELDALTVRSNTYREAFGYKVEAAGHANTAQLKRREANSLETAGFVSAGSTLLTGAGDGFRSYRRNTNRVFV